MITIPLQESSRESRPLVSREDDSRDTRPRLPVRWSGRGFPELPLTRPSLTAPGQQKRNSHKKHKKAQKGQRKISSAVSGRANPGQPIVLFLLFRVFLCFLWLFLLRSLFRRASHEREQTRRDSDDLYTTFRRGRLQEKRWEATIVIQSLRE